MDYISFNTQIKEEDLFRFNWHHALSQKIFSITITVLLVLVLILRYNTLSLAWRAGYLAMAVVILFYVPFTLKTKAKLQMQQEVFKHPISYQLKEDGIYVSSETAEEPAVLPWEYVYKVATWKDYLLIYSNRINAYIIPNADIQSQYENVVDYIKNHVEDYKLQIK